MTAPVTTVRNLGPAMAAAFARAGIGDAASLRALGADAAYAALLQAGERPHFMAYLAVVLGLQDRPFDDATTAEKAALRARFDALKARSADPGIDIMLRDIGLIDRRGRP